MRTFSKRSIEQAAGRRAFTLIELLAVIAIIGVLASLTVGVTALVSRKSKEARTRAELAKIELAIRNYHSKFGFYPPDNLRDPYTLAVDPEVNQLYYELTGALFDRATGVYRVGAGGEGISRATYNAVFGAGTNVPGIFNSSESRANIRNFLAASRESHVEHIKESPPDAFHLDALAVPVRWPISHPKADTDLRFVPPLDGFASVGPGVDQRWVNPWRYVSSNPTNNPGEFDLWAEIVIGDEIVVIGNWEEK